MPSCYKTKNLLTLNTLDMGFHSRTSSYGSDGFTLLLVTANSAIVFCAHVQIQPQASIKQKPFNRQYN